MLAVDPAVDPLAVGSTLLRAAERYLRDRGARVIYAGGRAPLDPFYRSIYGASEWAGILDRHAGFVRVVEAEGYEVVARSTTLEANLAEPDVRDPKAAILRRQTRLEVTNDPTPTGWWDALALGHTTSTGFLLVAKADGTELARATTWDMAAFGRVDGRARVGLRAVEVVPERRRQGFGRYLVGEILRHARGEWAEVVAVATDRENLAAQGLYESAGFRAVGSAALYRKPGA